MKPLRRRRGIALMLAMVLVVLFLSLWSLAYRQVGAVLRLESARVQRTRADEGSLRAAAKALALLETGYPPSNPYSCIATLDTTDGSRSFLVTFTLESEGVWSVTVAPSGTGDIADAMPEYFTATSPP